MYSDTELRGRVAILAGASSEIGVAIANVLLRNEVKVVLGCNDHCRDVEKMAFKLQRANESSVVIQADLRNAADQHRLIVDSPKESFGRPADILIHAVSAPDRAALANLSAVAISNALALGPVSFLLCSQLFVGALEGMKGEIVAISSTAALMPYPKGHAYVAAQGAIMSAVRSLALELSPQVRVNAVLPGIVDTVRHRNSGIDSKRALQIPLGRMVYPSEIAEAVLFLLRCQAIIGQSIILDGGATIKMIR